MMDAVLVSGASTGIGRASAELLKREGLKVFAGARKDSDLESLQEAGLTPVRLDVTDTETIISTIERIQSDTNCRLMALVNNAGIAVGGPLEAVSVDEVRRQFEVNVLGLLSAATLDGC